jgi:hypothetical protein
MGMPIITATAGPTIIPTTVRYRRETPEVQLHRRPDQKGSMAKGDTTTVSTKQVPSSPQGYPNQHEDKNMPIIVTLNYKRKSYSYYAYNCW